MTRPHLHTAATVLCVVVLTAIVFGPPTAPLWVRWAGLTMIIPTLLLFIVTAPR